MNISNDKKMSVAFLLLGANLGNRNENILTAKKQLEVSAGKIIMSSSVSETEPWGKIHQPAYLNQVLILETTLLPYRLLDATKTIEKNFGERIPHSWNAREMDIDILYYDSQVINNQLINIPHPYIPFRKFTLTPLVEIAPDFIHPVYRLSNAELLGCCLDTSTVLSTKQCGEKSVQK